MELKQWSKQIKPSSKSVLTLFTFYWVQAFMQGQKAYAFFTI
jgi:hypothetical protein